MARKVERKPQLFRSKVTLIGERDRLGNQFPRSSPMV